MTVYIPHDTRDLNLSDSLVIHTFHGDVTYTIPTFNVYFNHYTITLTFPDTPSAHYLTYNGINYQLLKSNDSPTAYTAVITNKEFTHD